MNENTFSSCLNSRNYFILEIRKKMLHPLAKTAYAQNSYNLIRKKFQLISTCLEMKTHISNFEKPKIDLRQIMKISLKSFMKRFLRFILKFEI